MSARRHPSLERLVASCLVALKPAHAPRWWILTLLILLAGALGGSGYMLMSRSTVAHVASTNISETPKAPPPSVFKDVTYCHNNLLDIYPPRTKAFKKAPFVIYLHGGGWEKNDKQSEPNQLAMLDDLRDKGFAVVSIDYRQLPGSPFPAALEDALCAVRFLKAKSAVYELDKQKVALYGFSAGGHIAALVAALPTDNQFNTGEYAEESSRVQAVVTLAGIFNLHDLLRPATAERAYNFLAGQEPSLAEPVTYVTADTPPFLLIHGLSDQYIYTAQDDYFAEVLAGVGVYHEQLRVENAGHGLEPVTGPIQPSEAVIKERLQDFIRAQLLK